METAKPTRQETKAAGIKRRMHRRIGEAIEACDLADADFADIGPKEAPEFVEVAKVVRYFLLAARKAMPDGPR